MKISNKIILSCLVLTTIISGVTYIRVSAQTNTTMSDQQIELIHSNCVPAKNTLSQLHASDALLRVNRGQIYESMSTKLMERFNKRLANNGFSNTNLVNITKSYGQMLDNFRSDYKSYEEQLVLAIEINCSNQPVSFYDAVALARTKRNQVNADVLELSNYINQYQLQLDQFENDYMATKNEVD